MSTNLHNDHENQLNNITVNTNQTIYNNNSCCEKIGMIIFFLALCFPITYCDLYYGIVDNSCTMHKSFKLPFEINDFLIATGILKAIGVFITVVEIIMEKKEFNTSVSTSTLVRVNSLPTGLYEYIWMIFGGIIFWAGTNTSVCSNGMRHYITASFILRYVIFGCKIFKSIK